ncbi:response regulator transcription factor [Thiomicrorhabdus indica]|uniref:response regulator transcription factor n=1 Tax=Thiomicrorhabdus indica TaxID=2267253 RepID=UPI00102DC7A2|nr:response regulator transcription factor [Thiomicrorhabdus indica]
MKDLTQLKNLNVLYVDDDPQACEKLGKILRYYFGAVYTATSASDAMDIFQQGKCHVLLVDYDMPIMNGADFLKEVRKVNSQIPAVIISSYDDKEKLFNAIELQLVNYLVKPYSLDQLKSLFHKVLDWIEDKGGLEKRLSDELVYSYSTKKLINKGAIITLAPSEFKILEMLLNNENRLVCYENLMDLIGDDCTHKSLVNQVHKLKKKLGIDIIQNVKDFGYLYSQKAP